jgi:16S rRNA G527 N7-methylase RsmG
VPLLEPAGVLVAWKRGEIADELTSGRRALDALGGGSIEVVPAGLPELPEHVLVVVAPADAAPAAYPRDPALRKRQPW